MFRRSALRWAAGSLVLLMLYVADTANPPALASEPSNDIAAAQALASPGPLAANDWGCQPDAAHPYPVILVHGANGNGASAWGPAAAYLTSRGYCVFVLDYGKPHPGALTGGSLDVSLDADADQLDTFVNGVLAATGARQVSFVGHSLGGIVARVYLRRHGTRHVDDVITFGSPHGGMATARSGASSVCTAGTPPLACRQLFVGSPYMTALNTPSGAEPDVDYTVAYSRYDRETPDGRPVSTPELTGPPADVTPREVQADCPGKWALLGVLGHALQPADPVMLAYAEQALKHDGPMPVGYRPRC